MTKVKILGNTWTVHLKPSKYFSEIGHTQALALTSKDENVLLFRSDYKTTYQTVVHELTHAYFTMLCVDSAKLKQGQLEEIACDLVAHHSKEIHRQSRLLFKKLKKAARW